MFQNLPTFLPEFEPNLPASNYVDRLIGEFTYVFRNRREMARSQRFLDRRKVRPIEGFCRWLEDDFNTTHDVDVFDQEIDDVGTVRFSKDRTEFLVYRMEALEDNFTRILTSIPGVTDCTRIDANRGFEKAYGELYRLFLNQNPVTEEMLHHYYENRFYKHFYE